MTDQPEPLPTVHEVDEHCPQRDFGAPHSENGVSRRCKFCGVQLDIPPTVPESAPRELFTIKISDDGAFRCQCGANVFAKEYASKGKSDYICNACGRRYEGMMVIAEPAPRPVPETATLCPTCGERGPHWVTGHEVIPDHKFEPPAPPAEPVEAQRKEKTMNDRGIDAPFDPASEKVYCARCGQQCVELGHMTNAFLLCPTHGEFTIAPVVMRLASGWEIHHRDRQAQMMWETCQFLDADRSPHAE